MEKSLQETYAPHNACYGCGPSNKKGFRIRSFPKGEKVIAHFKPEPHHEAFPGVLNGGVIGTLLDCHSNWTAAWHLMTKNKQPSPPCTVTADYKITLLKPTPVDQELLIEAEVVKSVSDRATIKATLSAQGKVTAICEGTFVAVQPGHPAYHRW